MAQSKISNPQSSEMTDMSNNSIFSETMENSTNPEVQPIAEQSETVQSKSTRPTAKQRKSELEDYRTAFFAPIKLGKDNKHQVAISNETFDRVERTARFFGGPGYSVSNFVEHIINEHLDNNAANYEGWFTLISKSF
ncbi:DUF3408 domain-containing protein [Muribaculaceae bacterium Isolate-110 (HZI)]|uniref:DUF3408 domain-containing protein n=1 Tax=Muribaculum intestinale TaxID=1796646 RepID=UPI000F462554|nr:DUF3408 domain-containing protein [Muribaculum intestinale]ROT18508.1 DUF3408 domain-containing protein [Muribaculaceae bacterium Isolate-110 (HZI)]